MWLGCPAFADVFVGCESAQGLEPSAVVVGVDEVVEMRGQLGVAVVMIAFDRGFLDRPVHPFHLSVGPGMLDLGETVLDAVLATAHVEHVRDVLCRGAVGVARREGELDAVVGQYRVDRVGHGLYQGDEEGRGRRPAGLRDKLDEGELAGPVDRDIEIELAFGGADLGDVDVEVADRVGLELALRLLVACHLGQPADPVSLEAAMQRRAGQMRDRRLQGVKAVVERQQGMFAERDDDRLFFDRQHRRMRVPRTRWQVPGLRAPLPLGDGLLVDAVALRQNPQALLTMLYRSTVRALPCKICPTAHPSIVVPIVHHQMPGPNT